MLALRYTKVNTTSGPVFGRTLLVMVFILFGAGILGKDKEPGELSWLPIGAHAVPLLCIAWTGEPMGDRA